MVPAIGNAASVIASKIAHSREVATCVKEYAACASVFPGEAPMRTTVACVLTQRPPRKKHKKLWRKRYTFARTGAEAAAGFVPLRAPLSDLKICALLLASRIGVRCDRSLVKSR